MIGTSGAIAGIVGGPIAGLIMSTMGGIYGLANWQWVFILEGIPSVFAGIAVILYLPDKPEEASWLERGQSSYSVWRAGGKPRS
jgi:MFS family permease